MVHPPIGEALAAWYADFLVALGIFAALAVTAALAVLKRRSR